MRRLPWLMTLLALAATAWAGAPPSTRESLATLVVYNSADPESVRLADYYARARGIPREHMLGLHCPVAEEISRRQYDDTIAGPMREAFAEHGWWSAPRGDGTPVYENQIRFVALIRGIPLKIAPVAVYPGDIPVAMPQLNVNAASVDSELALLGLRTRQISGPLANLYYKSFTPFLESPFAPEMLVCRLDAPTPRMVEKMIDGALAAERNGLQGFAYADLRGITTGNYALGDQWIATAAVTLRKHGLPLVWDSAEATFPEDFPMTHVAVYLGWYTQDVSGPFARPDFQFEPGAIAVHIHSYSASTLRSPVSNWAGPLLAHGAAATLGNVYEPFLALTPNLDIFIDRLKSGSTFAESAYASQQVLSWMTTFIGDPLYRPFSGPGLAPDTAEYAQYEACRRGAYAWYGKGPEAGAQLLAASARRLHSGIVWEELGLLQWSVPDGDAAAKSFREAENCYGHSDDGVRALLHQLEILRGKGRLGEARKMARQGLKQYQGLHGCKLLAAIAGES